MSGGLAIRAILFDAGGTLIHVDGARFCAAAGLPYRPEDFVRAEGEATAIARGWIRRHPDSTDADRFPVFLDRFLEALGIADREERLEAAARIVEEHHRANLWSGEVPGAREALEELRKRGYRLGVVSNADGRVQKLLENAGLSPLLEIVLDSAHLGVEKPDPRIFAAAAERLGLATSACAYVGDLYEIDIVGARAAGLRGILIGDCPAPEPVERISSLAALLDLFPPLAIPK